MGIPGGVAEALTVRENTKGHALLRKAQKSMAS